MGRDSSVGIAARYGREGQGTRSRRGRDFPHLSRPALGPTQPPVNGYRVSLPGVKRPGRSFDHPPLLAPKLKKA